MINQCLTSISFWPVFVAEVTLNRKTSEERRLSCERKLLWLLCQPQNDRVLGLFQLLHCRAATACEYEINMEIKSFDPIFNIAALFKVEVGINFDFYTAFLRRSLVRDQYSTVDS